MNFRKRRTPKIEVEEIDITSLLDILVILLVFLLKSFNDSELTVDLVNELALPYSLTRTTAENGPIVQVNKREEIYFNNKRIGSMSARGLNKLDSILKSEFREDNEKRKKLGREVSDNKLINLVFDKGLKYITIDKVLGTASEAGYGQYKLIVQGED
ncbi:MAG: hypothetical protein CME62_03040 [Halobacteriovoraceae bacterium]|nr:hypothetical protein [Halobacteriovoraceae bacterium]|tara:strand:+ start:10373 stop:10843 length:471 start_codon:yes stop_codon:yes gene_type:complete